MSTLHGASIPANRPARKSRPFLMSGLLAVLFTAITTPLGLLAWLPAVGSLLERGRTVGAIALLTITLGLWVVLFCLIRMRFSARERALIRHSRYYIDSPDNGADDHIARITELGGGDSKTSARLRTLATVLNGEQADGSAMLASRSELDHARGDVSYMPARALVWALPALGFLGTAAEMAHAIGGLSTSVGATTGYSELRSALVSDVIPPLADAFGVTLFALSAAVVCHLMLTWANTADQRALLDVEEFTMDLIATYLQSPVPTGPAASLNGEVGELITALTTTRTSMEDSARQVSTMDLHQLSHLRHLERLDLSRLAGLTQLEQLVPLLHSANERLDQIHTELRRDFVLTRLTVPDQRS